MKKKPKGLQSLKEKMIALQSGDFDVEAENPRIVKCWEKLNCEKKDCPAYGKLRCWSIAGTFCHEEVQGEFAQKLGDCRECIVYKESCGDEISEFVEVFNQMAKDLKFNISEQEKSDKEKARSERSEELGNMIASIAHETLNPLHSIGIAASYLKKNFHGELVTEFLNIIEDEVNKLNTLTSIFLSFSNPEPLVIKSCDMNSIVRSTIEEFKNADNNMQISNHLELEDSLANIPCDSARISEALIKLLENANEASPEGSEVIVRTKAGKDEVILSVSDNGPGIAREEQDRIFKPFYTTKTHGPGLGLATVERTAREHSGSVSVESSPGKGATFTIILPVGPDS